MCWAKNPPNNHLSIQIMFDYSWMPFKLGWIRKKRYLCIWRGYLDPWKHLLLMFKPLLFFGHKVLTTPQNYKALKIVPTNEVLSTPQTTIEYHSLYKCICNRLIVSDYFMLFHAHPLYIFRYRQMKLRYQ